MASIKFWIGEDKREWFRLEVSELHVAEGHVDDDIKHEHPEAYGKFKASLEAPAPEAAPAETGGDSQEVEG